jgi:hypothetical protein
LEVNLEDDFTALTHLVYGKGRLWAADDLARLYTIQPQLGATQVITEYIPHIIQAMTFTEETLWLVISKFESTKGDLIGLDPVIPEVKISHEFETPSNMTVDHAYVWLAIDKNLQAVDPVSGEPVGSALRLVENTNIFPGQQLLFASDGTRLWIANKSDNTLHYIYVR